MDPRYDRPASHEALCRRCGTSCHNAIPVNGIPVVVPGLACRYLAEEARGRFTCTVYPRRFELAPWCRTSEEALAAGLLAQDCPYAAGRAGYRGKMVPNARTMAALAPTLRRHIVEVGVPASVDPARVLPFLEGDGSRWEATFDMLAGRYRFRERAK